MKHLARAALGTVAVVLAAHAVVLAVALADNGYAIFASCVIAIVAAYVGARAIMGAP